MLNHEQESKKLLDIHKHATGRAHISLGQVEKTKTTDKTTAKSLKKKVNDKIVSLKEEKTLITRFLVMARQRPEIDLPVLLGNF